VVAASQSCSNRPGDGRSLRRVWRLTGRRRSENIGYGCGPGARGRGQAPPLRTGLRPAAPLGQSVPGCSAGLTTPHSGQGGRMAGGQWRAGVDIGGTFTDLLLVDGASGQFRVGKVLTT